MAAEIPRISHLARTPSPPEDNGIPRADRSLMPSGHTHSPAPSIHEDYDYDIKAGLTDSPERRPGGPRIGNGAANLLSPARANFTSNHSYGNPYTQMGSEEALTDDESESNTGSIGPSNPGPFNFVPVQYTSGKGSIGKSDVLGKRRGHKYRHSSIHASHMDAIFKPPPSQRNPLTVPSSLPMPTRREAWWSMTRDQTRRVAWCACHFIVAGYVQFSGAGSLAMTTLSRLLLFDAAAASICVVVDVMGNFEVWQRSSIKHPFGLERADVLAGFGMAVFIAFMGLDIISHGIQHSLENVGEHVPHSSHHHDRVTAGSVDVASILAIVSTLVSALLLKNHGRIGKAMRFEVLAGWAKIFGNPSHFLTLSCAVSIVLLPFLPISSYGAFDMILSFIMAGLMIALGIRLGMSLTPMLLMSFNPPAEDKDVVRNVIREITFADPAVTRVDEARFWQVHYGLCMANLKIRYRTSKTGYAVGEDVIRIRQKVTELVKRRFAGMKWEVSVQLTLDS